MTRDELCKVIAKCTHTTNAENRIIDAVDAYTSALLKQCNVSGALPSNSELDTLLNKLLAEMRHQDPYLAYRPTEDQMDKLRLVVWMWLTAERQ